MKPRIREGIARIDVMQAGRSISRGTGTLVADGVVLTALHVVADRARELLSPYPGEILLTFPTQTTKATILESYFDRNADWVLLRCEIPPAIRPVPLAELREAGGPWETFGFPDANPRDGMVNIGEVSNPLATLEGNPVFQLYSREAAAGQGEPVKGFSGAPVLVQGALVGLLRFALMKDAQTVAGTLYACPIQSVLQKAGKLLPLPDPCFGLPGLPVQPLPSDPYRYLARFTDKDSEVFFGRNREIRQLYDRLTADDAPPLTLLFGQSGVGKSSVLDAGLVPRLRWYNQVLYLRRDHQKSLLAAMEDALAPPKEDAAVESGARPRSSGLADSWKAAEQRAGKPLIVLFDQIEEVFTLPRADAPNDLDEFMAALKQTFSVPSQAPRGRLVLSFRKEWFPEIQKQVEQAGLNYGKVFLEGLDHDAILEVVNGLCQTRRLRDFYKLQIEPSLPEAIAQDLLADRDSPIAPTLQILLTKMWRKATAANAHAPVMSRDLYRELRNDGVAFGDFLDQQLVEFGKVHPQEADSGLAMDILAYHTTPLLTSKQRSRRELLASYAHCAAAVPELLQSMARLFLLSDSSSDSGENATRLSHDTLAPLVRQRFDQSDKVGQRARRVVEGRTADWDGSVENSLNEASLSVVQRGLSGMRDLKPQEKKLVEASQQRHFQEQRRRHRAKLLRRIVLIVIVALAAAASILYVRARQQELVAEQAEHLASLRYGSTVAQNWLLMNPLMGLLNAIDVTGESLKLRKSVLPEAQRALSMAYSEAIESNEIPARAGKGATASTFLGAAVSPDGMTIAVCRASGEGYANVEFLNRQDVEIGSGPRAVHVAMGAGTQPICPLAFSPDGNLLASGGPDIRVWDLQRKALVGSFGQGPAGGAAPAMSVAFTPDGKYLVAGYDDGMLQVWTLDGKQVTHVHADDGLQAFPVLFPRITQPVKGLLMGGEPSHAPGSLSAVDAARGLAGETLIASGGDDGSVRLWRLEAGKLTLLRKFSGSGYPIYSLAITDRSNELLIGAGGRDGSVRIWDEDGKAAITPYYLSNPVEAIAFSPTTNIVAAGSSDGVIQFLDKTGAFEASFHGSEASVNSLAFLPDGNRLVSVGHDAVRFIDVTHLDGARRITIRNLKNRDSVIGAAFLSGGALVAGLKSGDFEFWYPESDSVRYMKRASVEGLTRLATNQQGSMIATGTADGRVELFDSKGNLIGTLPADSGDAGSPGWVVTRLAFSPDGKTLAVVHSNGNVVLWDTTAKRQRATVKIGAGEQIAFTATNDLLATTEPQDSGLRLHFWHLDGSSAGQISIPLSRGVTTLSFRPDGRGFITGDLGGMVRCWTMKGKEMAKPTQVSRGSVSWVAIGRKSERMFTATPDGFTSVWTLPEGGPSTEAQQLASFQSRSWVNSVSLSQKNDTIAVVGDDRIILWPVSWRAWLKEGCDRLRGHVLFKNPDAIFGISPESARLASKTCQALVGQNGRREPE